MDSLLKIIRNFKGYSLQTFAKKTNIPFTIISNYETNKTIPKDERICQLAEGLNIDKDLLFLSYGILPPQFKKNIKSFPFYYLEKIKEMCGTGPTLDNTSEEDVVYINKTELGKYLIKEKDPTHVS